MYFIVFFSADSCHTFVIEGSVPIPLQGIYHRLLSTHQGFPIYELMNNFGFKTFLYHFNSGSKCMQWQIGPKVGGPIVFLYSYSKESSPVTETNEWWFNNREGELEAANMSMTCLGGFNVINPVSN